MKNTELQRKRMYRIVGAAMTLYNELGFGYAEAIYQECLAIVFDEMGIVWESEALLSMYFHDQELVKKYRADFVCYNDILVEIKAVSELLPEHRAQLFNYMRITQKHFGIIINFGEEGYLHAERYQFNSSTNKMMLVKG